MVLGSRDTNGGIVLLYGTDDPQAAGGWRFLNVLFSDSREGMSVVECPGAPKKTMIILDISLILKE